LKRERLRAYAWVAGCTLLGVVVGLGAGRAWAEHAAARTLFDGDHDARERLFLEALDRELDLNASQRSAIAQITARHAPERRQAVRRVFSECGKDLAALQEQVDVEILAQLNDAQQARYRAWAERRKRRWQGDDSPPAHQ
jgi:hypothetical protein